MLKNYVGQQAIKRSLDPVLRQCREGTRPCPPMLLVGPSGTGKTELAKAISGALDRRMLTINLACGSIDAGVLRLDELQPHDVLFADEIHAIPTRHRDKMLPLLDAARQGESSFITMGNETFRLPPFTFIAATNEAGRLLETVQNRFVLRYSFRPYTVIELVEMARIFAIRENIHLLPGAERGLAVASLGNPRQLRNLVLRVSLGVNNASGVVTEHAIQDFLQRESIAPDGLTPEHIDYLQALRNNHPRPVPLTRLACLAYQDERELCRRIEPALQRLSYIQISSAGRRLTQRGVHRINQENAQNV